MDLLATLKLELNKQGTGDDDHLLTVLNGARATFSDSTGRNLDAPADGDPETTVIRPINGGIVRVPDLRSVSKVEVSARRLSPTWAEVTGYDAVPWFDDNTFVWLTLGSDTAWPVLPTTPWKWARITGQFGMHPLPRAVEGAVVTLAAHRWRARGSEAAGTWEMPDGQAVQTFQRLPADYNAAVRDYKVPAPVLSTIGVG